jgi:hypothetical protein
MSMSSFEGCIPFATGSSVELEEVDENVAIGVPPSAGFGDSSFTKVVMKAFVKV